VGRACVPTLNWGVPDIVPGWWFHRIHGAHASGGRAEPEEGHTGRCPARRRAGRSIRRCSLPGRVDRGGARIWTMGGRAMMITYVV
jgi:hypothetical protein